MMESENEKDQIKKTLIGIIRLRCKTQKKTPLEVIREMKYEIAQMKKK